jgi:hypothetical protein
MSGDILIFAPELLTISLETAPSPTPVTTKLASLAALAQDSFRVKPPRNGDAWSAIHSGVFESDFLSFDLRHGCLAGYADKVCCSSAGFVSCSVASDPSRL